LKMQPLVQQLLEIVYPTGFSRFVNAGGGTSSYSRRSKQGNEKGGGAAQASSDAPGDSTSPEVAGTSRAGYSILAASDSITVASAETRRPPAHQTSRVGHSVLACILFRKVGFRL
jgi:hypothetical protein